MASERARSQNANSLATIPTVPPRSTVFLDGFTAGFLGVAIGTTLSLVVAAALAYACFHTPLAVQITCGIIGVMNFVGCYVHLLFTKLHNRVSNKRQFVGVFLVALVLGALMWVILPGGLLLLFLYVRSRSIREEFKMVSERLMRPHEWRRAC